MKKYEFKIKTSNVSSKEVCHMINKDLAKKAEVECYNFDGSKVYILTNEATKTLKQKIEKLANIEINNLIEKVD